jgi:hypothetical protein
MPDPKAVTADKARELLAVLAAEKCEVSPDLRVTLEHGGLGCLILVWNGTGRSPASRRPATGSARPAGERAGCRRDVLEVLAAGRVPLTFKEVLKALRDAGRVHGKGTVMKALADLTKSRELVNLRDKRGYRLPEWPRTETPSLF